MNVQPTVRAAGPPTLKVDSRALERELAQRVSGEVRFDNGSRAAYASDASNYRQVPIGVVLPQSTDDIVAAIEICRKYDSPILMRGGGTSQNGQRVNVAGAIDTSKYLNRALKAD